MMMTSGSGQLELLLIHLLDTLVPIIKRSFFASKKFVKYPNLSDDLVIESRVEFIQPISQSTEFSGTHW